MFTNFELGILDKILVSKILPNKFCSLSTSPAWQAWLYNFNVELYYKFTKRMQTSRGCDQNRGIMMDILIDIDNAGGGDLLIAFLKKNYPTTLLYESDIIKPKEADAVFSYYNPNILTYPRRLIITNGNLNQKVTEFLSGKPKSDFEIIGDKAYVEYLLPTDSEIVNNIPEQNWMIKQWRLKQGKVNS